MSSSEPLRPRLRVLALMALLPALALGACGFRPLHQPPQQGRVTASDELAGVLVDPLPDRTGQQLHNLLIDQLNPQGQPTAPSHRLHVDLTEVIRKVAVQRDETATRANLILSSNYTLRAVADNSVVYAGRAVSINSYNILDEQYPTDVARDNARLRGLRELSDDIKLRLSIYFSSGDDRS